MIANTLIGVGNLLILAVSALIKALMAILPVSPFQNGVYQGFVDGVSDYLPGLNWIIPVGAIVSILGLWLTAITMYYVAQIALRWAKAIE